MLGASLLLSPIGAHAQATTTKTDSKVSQARRLIVRDDLVAAGRILEKAIEQDAQSEAIYYLAVVRSLENNAAAALELFRRAAAAAKSDRHRAMALIGAARLLSSNPAARPEAREAWVSVLNIAKEHAEIVGPEMPRSYIETLDKLIEQEAVYIEVRRRIANRLQTNANGSSDTAGSTQKARNQREASEGR